MVILKSSASALASVRRPEKQKKKKKKEEKKEEGWTKWGQKRERGRGKKRGQF